MCYSIAVQLATCPLLDRCKEDFNNELQGEWQQLVRLTTLSQLIHISKDKSDLNLVEYQYSLIATVKLEILMNLANLNELPQYTQKTAFSMKMSSNLPKFISSILRILSHQGFWFYCNAVTNHYSDFIY